MFASGDRSNEHFRVEVIKESLIPEVRNQIKDEDLILVFSALPDSVNVQKSAHYTDEAIPGRSEPWKVYSHSGSTMIDFTARLVAMGTDKGPSIMKQAFTKATNMGMSVAGQVAGRSGLGGEFAQFNTWAPRVYRGIMSLSQDKSNDEIVAVTFEEVTKKAYFLESLLYSQCNDDGIVFPPPLINLRYGGNFLRRGVIKDVRFRLLGPWELTTGLCMVIETTVTMEEVNKVPRSYLQVRNFSGKGGDGSAGQPPKTSPFKKKIENRVRSMFGL